jgi:alanine racemase
MKALSFSQFSPLSRLKNSEINAFVLSPNFKIGLSLAREHYLFVPSTQPTKTPVSPPRAWAEVDLSALRHNLQVARDLSGQEIMAVVKAGAYGHGLEPLATALDSENLAFLGVANVGEARRLTKVGLHTPIYLLGPTLPEEREEAVLNGWHPCLSSMAEARHFSELAAQHDIRVDAHLAIDTGMGRGGFLPSDASAALAEIRTLPGIDISGLGSHLPSADEDPTFTTAQFTLFDSIAQELLSQRPSDSRPFHIHLANSAGLLGYQSKTTNLVRPGLLLYGVSPLPEFQEKLRAVMTLKSRVSVIRKLPAGHGISYGRSYLTTRPTKVATIGIGYGDGYPRALSGKGAEVLIHGQRCPILGRVTMDQIMVDVTDLPSCTPGDEVELFGPHLPVAEIAQRAGTIPWEVFTSITPRVTRIYL